MSVFIQHMSYWGMNITHVLPRYEYNSYLTEVLINICLTDVRIHSCLMNTHILSRYESIYVLPRYECNISYQGMNQHISYWGMNTTHEVQIYVCNSCLMNINFVWLKYEYNSCLIDVEISSVYRSFIFETVLTWVQ